LIVGVDIECWDVDTRVGLKLGCGRLVGKNCAKVGTIGYYFRRSLVRDRVSTERLLVVVSYCLGLISFCMVDLGCLIGVEVMVHSSIFWKLLNLGMDLLIWQPNLVVADRDHADRLSRRFVFCRDLSINFGLYLRIDSYALLRKSNGSVERS